MFTVVDWGIVIIVALSGGFAFFRGFVKEAISLTAWVAAFIVAGRFNDVAAPYFSSFISDESVRLTVAYIALFIATLLAIGLCGSIIRTILHSVGLSGSDHLLGMVFGIARGVLIICVILAIMRMGINLHILSVVQDNPAWVNSLLVPELQKVVDWILAYSPEIPEIKAL